MVIDNAKYHRSPELRIACAEAGVRVEFLPPYLPDLNPIETSFTALKHWIRQNTVIAIEYESNPALGGFGVFLRHAILGVHPVYGSGPDPKGLFRHSGYVSRDEYEDGISAQ